MQLFADDTIAYMAIKILYRCQIYGARSRQLAIWEGKRNIAFYPDKCNFLCVTRNKNIIKFNYTLHVHPLVSLEEAKCISLRRV